MTDTLYRLRPLEWVELMPGLWRAITMLGSYDIWLEEDGRYRIRWPYLEWHDRLEAAQSAAEAHYRARLAEGLIKVETYPMASDLEGRVVHVITEPTQ